MCVCMQVCFLVKRPGLREVTVSHDLDCRHVQCVKPCLVATSMTQMKRHNLLVAEPGEFARSAVGTLGYQQSTFGCLSHAVQVSLTNFKLVEMQVF